MTSELREDPFDALERRSSDERQSQQLASLRTAVEFARRNVPAYSEGLRNIDPRDFHSLSSLAMLPIIRKQDLMRRQRAGLGRDPFGGFSAERWGAGILRVFSSPGPVYEPQSARRDAWRSARALFAAGLRPGQLVHNALSYHMTPGAFMVESGAHSLGCTVFPAGTGQTELQVQAISELRPDAYVGTPSFLRTLLQKADADGVDVTSLRLGSTWGEGLPEEMRAEFDARGISVRQAYGTADVGLVAYETSARAGLVVDEGVIVEIVDPATGLNMPEGEIGELVVTTLDSVYPMLRYGTGDLSAMLGGVCPTGRTGPRVKGWLGRTDQSVKVRGMFIHPSQVAQVVRRFAAITMARLRISRDSSGDSICLLIEAPAATAGLSEQVKSAMRETTKLRCDVRIVATGELPRDDKRIEDLRTVS